MTENSELPRSEVAFLEIQLELSILQTRQDMFQAYKMCCEVWRKGNDIIDVT